MSNLLQLHGAQSDKPTRFAPIYTPRWFTGLYTNRSPLRDAKTTRIAEKFYGADGDALIAGLNVELSNRLTLIRRPGNPVFDGNSYTGVNRFEDFRLFSTTSEQINVMVDEANQLSSLFNGVKTSVWSKSAQAQGSQTYMQGVGNSLYFSNGIDQKKWLQTLNTWANLKALSAGSLGTGNYPFMTTFLVDSSNNLEQLVAFVLQTVTNVAQSGTTVTFTVPAVTGIVVGQQIVPWLNVHTQLNGQVLTVTSAAGTTVVATSQFSATIASGADTGALTFLNGIPSGSNLTLGGSQPTWSTTVPSGANHFAGGVTVDGSALWINRGSYVENWGLKGPSDLGVTSLPVPTSQGGSGSWVANTFYSSDGVIIDSNGNLQQVTTAGKSGSVAPTWATVDGNTTSDGTVTWTQLQTAAELVWAAHTHYAAGHYIKATASDGTPCLYKLVDKSLITYSGTIQAQYYLLKNPLSNPLNVAIIGILFPASSGWSSPDFGPVTVNSLLFAPTGTKSANIQPMTNAIVNGNGEITGYTTPYSGATQNYAMSCFGAFAVTKPCTIAFGVSHDDGFIFGMDGGATATGLSVNLGGTVVTPVKNYPVLGGNNQGGNNFDIYQVTFPAAGTYHFEFLLAQASGEQQLAVSGNGTNFCVTPLITSTSAPVFPAWTLNTAPNKPTVWDSSNAFNTNFQNSSNYNLQWQNLGPVSDMVWKASTNFHLAGGILDTNGNNQTPYRAGISGSAAPAWKTTRNQLTVDNSSDNLTWIEAGPGQPQSGSINATSTQGWKYAIALVNTLDNTVSNCGPISNGTGAFTNSTGTVFAAGAGLPSTQTLIDSQADYVAVFRTTDGLSTEFLVPGVENALYTVPLTTYLQNGYVDSTPDTGLNNLLEGPVSGENTVPASGAVNLTYHLNRIFFSVGNVVYWTAGPDAPIGNGTNGVLPTNFDTLPSFVKRIVPTPIGALVFTVSDIYLIQGNGTSSSPILPAQPFELGIGLLSYNALDINGSVIGFFSSDREFVILDPHYGVTDAGFPIGDQLRLNNGGIGTSWNPATAYVTRHTYGEDSAWYLSDGATGWYRLMDTPSPESGHTWSPFAQIGGGCKAVQSIEVTPGVHKLLLGPTGTGSILNRDLSTFSDNGTAYIAWTVLGSIVLAHPGQLAELGFITTDSVRAGTPLSLGLILDEALPYYTGPFEPLTNWGPDPPDLATSTSLYAQRFYVSNNPDAAALCRHMQIRLNWVSEAAGNELLTMTLFGAFVQEK